MHAFITIVFVHVKVICTWLKIVANLEGFCSNIIPSFQEKLFYCHSNFVSVTGNAYHVLEVLILWFVFSYRNLYWMTLIFYLWPILTGIFFMWHELFPMTSTYYEKQTLPVKENNLCLSLLCCSRNFLSWDQKLILPHHTDKVGVILTNISCAVWKFQVI